MTEFTQHALSRAQQRGVSPNDIEVVMRLGTTVRRGLRVLCDSDAAREIRFCKRRIQQLERLRGVAVVEDDGVAVTVYHLDGKPGARSLRRDGKRRQRKQRRQME